MPPSGKKGRCTIPGCNNAVAPGHACCASHLTALRSSHSDRLLASLCEAMHRVSQAGDLADRGLIDEELRTLYAVRSLYLAWLQERADGDAATEPPTRLLRAWGDSTARVIQLLKARRALSEEREDGFEAMMSSVLDKVDQILSGVDEAVGC